MGCGGREDRAAPQTRPERPLSTEHEGERPDETERGLQGAPGGIAGPGTMAGPPAQEEKGACVHCAVQLTRAGSHSPRKGSRREM